MATASGEINLESKHNLICHVAKVKAASAHSRADVVPFFSVSNFPYESNVLKTACFKINSIFANHGEDKFFLYYEGLVKWSSESHNPWFTLSSAIFSLGFFSY